MTTTLARLDDESVTTTNTVLPPVGERVIVQCEGFRCVGICDITGQWLDAFNNQPLSDVLWFKPFGSRRRPPDHLVHLVAAITKSEHSEDWAAAPRSHDQGIELATDLFQ